MFAERGTPHRGVLYCGLVVQGMCNSDALAGCFRTLDKLGIPYVRRILSAHRTPAEADALFAGAEADGVRVIIAAAGLAAHLAGAAASRSLLPVTGIPLARTCDRK